MKFSDYVETLEFGNTAFGDWKVKVEECDCLCPFNQLVSWEEGEYGRNGSDISMWEGFSTRDKGIGWKIEIIATQYDNRVRNEISTGKIRPIKFVKDDGLVVAHGIIRGEDAKRVFLEAIKIAEEHYAETLAVKEDYSANN